MLKKNHFSFFDDENDDDWLLISFVISLIIIMEILFLGICYIYFKTKKVKEDILLIERFLVTIVFAFFIIVEYISKNVGILIYGYLIYIGIYISNWIFITIEQFFQLKNPFFIFNSALLNKTRNILFEILTLLFSAIPIIIFFTNSNNFCELPIIIYISLFSIMIFIMSLINLIYFCINIPHLSGKNIKNKFIFKLISSILFLGYVILCFLVNIKVITFSCGYIFLIFMGVIEIDIICEIAIIIQSDFYYYSITEKGTKSCCGKCLFGTKRNSYVVASTQKKRRSQDVKKDDTINFFQNTLGLSNISCLSLELCEYYINLSLSSISLIFGNLANEIKECKKENSPLGINFINNSGSAENEITDSFLPSEIVTQKNLNYKKYVFNQLNFTEEKTALLTDYRNSTFDRQRKKDAKILSESQEATSDKFGKKHNNCDVEVRFYYFEQLKEILATNKVDLSEVKKSLISHADKTTLLLSKNSRSETFRDFKSLSIKSGDSLFTIDIFEDVITNGKANNVIVEYLNHITAKANTFLPLLHGIFWIKANNFSPFVMFISSNSVIEEPPEEAFNIWQLLKYTPGTNKIEQISTSKDISSVCITNDNLFDNQTKMKIRNFHNFKTVLKQDIDFLRRIYSKNFRLLIIYYEFGQDLEGGISFEQGDLSNIRVSFGKGFRLSNIGRISEVNVEGESMENADVSFVGKCSKGGKGFEARFNNFKSLILFSFENVFNFKDKKNANIDYDSYAKELLTYFDDLIYNEN